MHLAYMRIGDGQGHEAGRQLLEQLYRAYTDAPMPTVCAEPGGKPFFAPAENPLDLHFSISHTKGHAFCVLGEKPVGLDAEEMDRQVDLRLAEKILSAPEKQRFLAAADPRTALLKFWVLKEAAAKLTGRGLQGYPNHTNFDPEDSRVQIIDGCFVAILEEENVI